MPSIMSLLNEDILEQLSTMVTTLKLKPDPIVLLATGENIEAYGLSHNELMAMSTDLSKLCIAVFRQAKKLTTERDKLAHDWNWEREERKGYLHTQNRQYREISEMRKKVNGLDAELRMVRSKHAQVLASISNLIASQDARL